MAPLGKLVVETVLTEHQPAYTRCHFIGSRKNHFFTIQLFLAILLNSEPTTDPTHLGDACNFLGWWCGRRGRHAARAPFFKKGGARSGLLEDAHEHRAVAHHRRLVHAQEQRHRLVEVDEAM